MAKVLFVSAHPDDETLGAGGTLLKHHFNGDDLYWVIVTRITTEAGFSPERVKQRQDEIHTVSEMYGVKQVFQLNYPTMSLTSGSLVKMVPEIGAIVKEVGAQVIYTMNRSDAHSDHRVIFDAVAASIKSFRYPSVLKVLMYECISETEFAPALPEKAFLPNYFVDISSFIDKKLEIIQVFDSEISEHPFPRSLENIKALATFRGASVGVKYAEAFQLIKFIDK